MNNTLSWRQLRPFLRRRRTSLATLYLTEYSQQRGVEGLKLGNALLASIQARTDVLFGLRPPEGEKESSLRYQRVDCLPRQVGE